MHVPVTDELLDSIEEFRRRTATTITRANAIQTLLILGIRSQQAQSMMVLPAKQGKEPIK